MRECVCNLTAPLLLLITSSFPCWAYSTQVFVEADFKVQYNPSESGEGGRTDYLIQHRSLNVLAKPKTAAEGA